MTHTADNKHNLEMLCLLMIVEESDILESYHGSLKFVSRSQITEV